jgi:hypothetical protein
MYSWTKLVVVLEVKLTIGRSKFFPFNDNEDHGNELWLPTWACKWDVISKFTPHIGPTNEFDI